MKLYYSKGSCSFAVHMALHEAQFNFAIEPVNLATKQYSGGDFFNINPKGYVPVLELDNGERLSEVAIILQYVADQKPELNLIPRFGNMERYHAMEWLNFIATELHKNYSPLWSKTAPAETKAASTEMLFKRYDLINRNLSQQNFMLGNQFSVVDAYLFTVTMWSQFLHIDLQRFTNLTLFMDRVKHRSSTIAAFSAEGINKY